MREGGFNWYHETAMALLMDGATKLEDTVISSLPDGWHEVQIKKLNRSGYTVEALYEGRAGRTFKQMYDTDSAGFDELTRVVGSLAPGNKLKINIVTGGEYEILRSTTGEYIIVSRETGSIHGIRDTLESVRDFRPDRFVARHVRIP